MKTTREIKFRFYMADKKEMVFPKGGYGNFSDLKETEGWKVMQYTGLKDKNGKEVYEGDILKQYNQKRLCVVEFIDEKENGRHFCGFRIHNPEKKIVIGNIHENPELLTKTQDEN